MNNKVSPEGITIYCGSGAGNAPEYAAAARAVGRAVALAGLTLVSGGGHMGMMGQASRAAREAGGKTVAIIPQFMIDRGWNDPEADTTVATPDMHRRKELMAASACGVIAMPGGVGTFEELTEIITWRQLGLYGGNIVILNIKGYYDPLLLQMARAVECGFLPEGHDSLWTVTSDPDEAVRLASAPATVLNLKAKL